MDYFRILSKNLIDKSQKKRYNIATKPRSMYYMKIFFASLDPVFISEQAKNSWLYVLNCGYYRDVRENLHTRRAAGRSDYHLIYVKSGQMLVNGEVLSPGSLRIYVPGEQQDYTYTSGENTNYFWVHFTGTQAKAILDRLKLGSGIFHFNDRIEEAEKIWLLLCESTFFKLENTHEYSASLLLSLLNLLATPKEARSPFSKAAKLLEDMTAKVSVPELAHKYHMSVGHFIESFKKAYGYTPMNYRAIKQFDNAKILLKEMDLPISTISEMCGFADPLYFSRQFKKRIGISPTEYRNQFNKREDGH